MLIVATLLAVSLQGGDVPEPHRDLRLFLVSKSPGPTYPWWPVVVEAWVENLSDHEVPIVRAMDGSWEDWTEPYLAWSGTLTTPDGSTWPLPTGAADARCGVFDSDWVEGVVVVPPRGRQRILRQDIGPLFRKGFRHLPDWHHGSVELRLEYVYRARPAPVEPVTMIPSGKNTPFGALEGAAPFQMVSDVLYFELLPPSVRAQQLAEDLAIDVELEDGERIFSWEPLRLRAWLRNTSERTYHVLHPGGGALLGIGHAEKYWFTTIKTSDGYAISRLEPGDSVELLIQELLGRFQFYNPKKLPTGVHELQLSYEWNGEPRPSRLGQSDKSASEDPLAGIPPFRLRSPSFQIAVSTPLELQLVQRAQVPRTGRFRLFDVLGLIVRNTGDEPLVLASPEEPLEIRLHAPDSWSYSFGLKYDLVLPPNSELDLGTEPALRDRLSMLLPPGMERTDQAEAYLDRASWVPNGHIASGRTAVEIR